MGGLLPSTGSLMGRARIGRGHHCSCDSGQVRMVPLWASAWPSPSPVSSAAASVPLVTSTLPHPRRLASLTCSQPVSLTPCLLDTCSGGLAPAGGQNGCSTCAWGLLGWTQSIAAHTHPGLGSALPSTRSHSSTGAPLPGPLNHPHHPLPHTATVTATFCPA